MPQRSSKYCGEDRYEQKIPAIVMHRLSCPRTCGIFPDWIKPVSPALAGRFFTTEPPGKSRRGSLFRELCLESTLPRVRVFPHLRLGKGTSLGLRGTEKAMAPHSSTLAWKIPWMEEPGGLQSMGLSDFPFTFHFHALEKEMATHSSVLVWRIPGTGEPGGLPSMGSHRAGHD